MNKLFARLQSKIDKRNQEKGIRPADLLTLPPAQRRVMQLLLREVQLTYPEILTAVSALPPTQRISPEELDSTLSELTKANWLLRMGQDQLITYRVNLQHKPGSKVAADIWFALEDRLKETRTRK